jgi:hypothetical protein
MITQIESCLKEVLGKLTIKSILISSHFQEGIDRVEGYQQFSNDLL